MVMALVRDTGNDDKSMEARMKRYRGEVRVYWQEGAKVEMVEDPNGEWVKNDDILHAGIKMPGCNCEEMAIWARTTSWIQETMKKQIPVKIDADIVRWFDKEKYHDINTILKGHVRLVEAQRKAANTPDQIFRPMLKPDKKKGKGKIKK